MREEKLWLEHRKLKGRSHQASLLAIHVAGQLTTALRHACHERPYKQTGPEPSSAASAYGFCCTQGTRPMVHLSQWQALPPMECFAFLRFFGWPLGMEREC